MAINIVKWSSFTIARCCKVTPLPLVNSSSTLIAHCSIKNIALPRAASACYPSSNVLAGAPRCHTGCRCWCCSDRCLGGGGCAGEPSNILANPRPTVGVEQSTSCFTSLGTQLTTALVCTLLLGSRTTKGFSFTLFYILHGNVESQAYVDEGKK